MKTLMMQVDEELFTEYTEKLTANGFQWEQASDFTKVGRWCLVKVEDESWARLDLAEEIYDGL